MKFIIKLADKGQIQKITKISSVNLSSLFAIAACYLAVDVAGCSAVKPGNFECSVSSEWIAFVDNPKPIPKN